MNRTPSPSESLIGLLQPYVDGHLDDEARAAVDARLAAEPELRAMIDEQLAARQALRELPCDPAPSGLRARLLLELDAVDREEASAPPAPRPLAPRRSPRLAAFARGGLVMAPAAVAAAVLFAVVRLGTPSTPTAAAEPTAPAEGPVAARLEAPTAQGAPLVLGADTSRPVDGVRLVGLGDLESIGESAAPAAFEYTVDGGRVLGLQRPAGAVLPPGTRQVYRGQVYTVARDRSGRVVIFFSDRGVDHFLMAATTREPWARGDAEVATLLDLADRVRRGH